LKSTRTKARFPDKSLADKFARVFLDTDKPPDSRSVMLCNYTYPRFYRFRGAR
jgi:hypothetical protein